jgi:hypothetical protein
VATRHFGARDASASIAASSTVYSWLGNGHQANAAIATEANVTIPYRGAATFSNLYCRVVTNSRGASTFRLRVNTADVNSVCSIGSSATGEFEDTSNTDTISSGDNVNYKVTTGAGGAAFIMPLVSVTSSLSKAKYGSGAGVSTSTANNSIYFALSDLGTTNTTEARAQTKFYATGTLKSLCVNVSANARGSTTTGRSRVNTADGNQVVSIGGSATGVFEDTTNTDTIALGDLVCYAIRTGSGGSSITYAGRGIEFDYAATAYPIVAGTTTGVTYTTGITRYSPVGFINAETTESTAQAKTRFTGTLSKLQAYVMTNATTSPSSVRSRINTADGNSLVSIGSGTTGRFEDTSNADDITDVGDHIDLKTVNGGGGNLVVTLYALLAGTVLAQRPPFGVSLYFDRASAVRHYAEL